MNPGFEQLQPYPFEKLAALKKVGTPVSGIPLIDLSLGEPKHKTPDFILEALTENLNLTAVYPSTRGMEELRETIAEWLTKRFSLPVRSLTASQVLPVNGTREALFAISQSVVDRNKADPLSLFPTRFTRYTKAPRCSPGPPPVMPIWLKKMDFNRISPVSGKTCGSVVNCSTCVRPTTPLALLPGLKSWNNCWTTPSVTIL